MSTGNVLLDKFFAVPLFADVSYPAHVRHMTLHLIWNSCYCHCISDKWCAVSAADLRVVIYHMDDCVVKPDGVNFFWVDYCREDGRHRERFWITQACCSSLLATVKKTPAVDMDQILGILWRTIDRRRKEPGTSRSSRGGGEFWNEYENVLKRKERAEKGHLKGL